jgi:hypothetical protein
VITQDADRITADSVILGSSSRRWFATRYRITCDAAWRVRSATIGCIGNDPPVALFGDGTGNWTDATGAGCADLQGAIDIDFSLTPFTNTIPIRRLGLGRGESAVIPVVYVQPAAGRFSRLLVTREQQRYTCRKPHAIYRFESGDGTFTGDLTVDADGLVITYPGLFERLRAEESAAIR